MDVVVPLVADREPAVLRKPGQCALHHPSVSPQFLAALHALSCYAALYPAPSQGSFALLVVVGFVGMQLLGTFSRPAPTRTLDGLYGVDELFEDHLVVDVGSGEDHGERDPFSVRNKVALRALLPFIRRIRSGFCPLFWRGCSPNLVRHAPSRSDRPLRGAQEEPDVASPTPQPLATP
jgi:hypothetical protein